jgi:hypothetical protein
MFLEKDEKISEKSTGNIDDMRSEISDFQKKQDDRICPLCGFFGCN